MTVRMKKRICAWVGLLCLAAVILLVGGAERGWAPMSALWWAFALELVGATALWKAGVIRV